MSATRATALAPGRRWVVAAALLAVLASAGAAGAQEGRPVHGGGNFTQAPQLGPGTYRDVVRPGESVFYAVALDEAERLAAGIRLTGDPDAESNYTTARLLLYTPLRQDAAMETAGWDATDITELEVVGEPVGLTDGELFAEPGTYYLRVSLDAAEDNDVAYPTTIKVAVERVARGVRTGDPDPGDRDDEPGASAGALGLAGYLALAGGGLLLGAAAGALAAALRRSASGPPPTASPPAP